MVFGYSKLGVGKDWCSRGGSSLMQVEDVGAADKKPCGDSELAEGHGKNDKSGAGWAKIDRMSWMTRGDGLCPCVAGSILTRSWSMGISEERSP